MREAPRFRPAFWEGLEHRILPSLLGGASLPPSAVPFERVDPYARGRHEQDLEQAQARSAQVVFLGDSITDFWGDSQRPGTGSTVWYDRIAPLGAANFGVSADTTQSLLWRVTHGELDGRPRVIVLEIGTNNVGTGYTPQETAAGIAAVVSAIRTESPRSQVVLMGLFPRGQGDADPLTQKILEVNSLIAGLDDGIHVHFLDMSSAFLNPDGSLNRSLLPDTIHPSAQGYALWADAVLGPLDALLGLPDQAATDPLPQPAGPSPVDRTAATPTPALIPAGVDAPATAPAHFDAALGADLEQAILLIVVPQNGASAVAGDGITSLGQPPHKNRASDSLMDSSSGQPGDN